MVEFNRYDLSLVDYDEIARHKEQVRASKGRIETFKDLSNG